MHCRIIATAIASIIMCSCTTGEHTLYVGTYGHNIHVLSYNAANGALKACSTIPADSSSYVADGGLNSNGEPVLYAVRETGKTSAVISFACMDDGWRRTALCEAEGTDPCFILFDQESGTVMTADYSGGSYSVYGTEDGVIKGLAQRCYFPPKYPFRAPVPGRQDASHIHQIKRIPEEICSSAGLQGSFFLASDLGNDVIHVLRATGRQLEQVGEIQCGEGTGPRHMEFDNEAGMLYCLTELSGELISWKISSNGQAPEFKECQRLVVDRVNAHGSADIHMAPGGKWLYTSHRLQGDGISIQKVAKDGSLTVHGYVSTDIHPRNFTFSPDGRFMLVACRDSRSIQVFSVNRLTGTLKLSNTFQFAEDRPVCLAFKK